MEEFLKQKKKKNSLGFIIMALIGILLFIGGISSYNKEVVEKKWVDVSETNEYGYIDAQYLEGPYVEETYDGVKKEYYLAINQNYVVGCVLVKQNSTTEIPIVTTKEEYENVSAQAPKRMYGYSKNFDSNVSRILVEGLNAVYNTNEVNTQNLSKYVGKFYLDSTASNDDKTFGIVLIVLGAIFIILYPLSLLKNNKDYNEIKNEISKLKEDGKFEAYENDIQSSNSYKEKKYCTIIANENIYNIEKNFLVIPIQKVTNVYKCSMENGKISANDYICIETAENEVYGIAYKIRDKKDPKFDNLLNQIKQRMVR